MNELGKAIEDLQAVVKAYALGKVTELEYVLPVNAVLAAYAAAKAKREPA